MPLLNQIKSLGHPRAALLGFAVAVLAYNVLALLKRVTEQAHRASHPELDVSTFSIEQLVMVGDRGMIPQRQNSCCRPDRTWLL